MQRDLSPGPGQAVYTPLTLAVYDTLVLGLSCRFLWRCPAKELEALYARNVSARHIDVGVGTGYFLDKATWPVADPDILLVDLNPHSLNAAATRIGRFAPHTLTANILEPLPASGKFNSAGLCFLLHCLPGRMTDKAVLFDRLLPVLSPGAKVFGATILQGDAPRSRAAQVAMNLYNSQGIFSNAEDTFQDLEGELHKRFPTVRMTRRGAVAIFEAETA